MVKGYVTIPVGYKRVDNLPLLLDQLFTSRATAESYVKTDPTAYVGQIFSVVDSDTVTAFIVTATGESGTMKEIGSTPITSYTNLTDKPQIGGVELSGNKSLDDLGIAAKSDIPSVPTKVSELDNDSKFQTADEVSSVVSAAVTSLGKVFTLKGRVDSTEDLNSIESPAAGDLYLVGAAGTSDMQEYVYVDNRDTTGTGSWEHIGDPSVDLSGYYTSAQVDEKLADKVDVVSGKGLSTNDYTTAEKDKVAKILVDATEGSDELYLGKDGNYHQIPKVDGGEISADYKKLVNKPTVNGTEFSGAVEVSAATTPIDYGDSTSLMKSEEVGGVSKKVAIEVNLGAGVSIGGYKTGDKIYADDNIMKVLQTLLVKKISPTYKAPTLTLAGTTPYEVEIGTRKALTITPTFTQNDGGAATKYVLKKGSASTGTVLLETAAPQAYTTVKETVGAEQKDFQIEDSATFTASVEYAQGAVKKDNLGNDDETGRIAAGSKTATVTYTGRRAMFYGSSSNDIDVSSSAAIRSLGSSNLNPVNGTKTAIATAEGTKCIVVAYPATLEDVAEVMQKGTNLDVKGSFVKTTVDVEGADGYTAISYKVFKYTASAGLNADTFTVTI